MNMSERRLWRLTSPKQELALPSERAMHAAVMDWAHWAEGQWEELRGLFHVPNGELRDIGTARLLKRLGQKNGVPDFLLPTARGGYIGLALELKRKPNKVTGAQQAWLDFLAAHGWRAQVCWNAPEAIEVLQSYVSAEPTLFGKAFADASVPF